MNFVIRGKNIEVTQAIKEAIEKTFNKLKKYQFISEDVNIHIDVRTYREHLSKIEAIIDIPERGIKLFAEAIDNDLYDAIRDVYEKIEKQIKKIKGKWSHRNNEKFSKIISQEEENLGLDEDI